ncbi:MAG TPA: LysM peptidoglycan-binding domain-containing protein [Steroidobacteraceae bacterium]|nr:LysM peptidoglycan-binding domain-containing protein [Steroidobacteraceae bacterium]
MVSNQVLGVRLAAAMLILSGALASCAHTPPASCPPGAAPSPAAGAAGGEANAAGAPGEMTATEAAIAAAGTAGNAPTTVAPAPITAEMLKPNAPMHYTVKPGDTLWGIASMYLKDPWLWPEVWVINPQIPNPHLIYPGDTLALAYGAGGVPQVSVLQPGVVRMDPRLRSEPISSAIPTIPYSAIVAFTSRPTVATEEEIRRAPYVLAFRDMHQAAGSGNEIYLRHLTAGQNARFAIVHIENPLVDPDDGKVVGYQGIYTGTALVQRPGDPAKALLIDSARETLRGDRLLTTDSSEAPLTFTPHAPASQVCGTIIDAVDGTGDTGLVGQFEVVVINRGKRQGLEPGNVLAIDHKGDTERDLYRNGREIGSNIMGPGSDFAPRVTLPNERSGTMLVFKVFDRVSYGLVVGADDIIYVGDVVRSP